MNAEQQIREQAAYDKGHADGAARVAELEGICDESDAALSAAVARVAELTEKLEWVKHALPPSRSDELTEWLDNSDAVEWWKRRQNSEGQA